MSRKFESEIERFVTDYYKDHDEAKEKLDKWAADTEKGLRQFDTNAGKFEKELETQMGKIDKKALENEKNMTQLDAQAQGLEKNLEPRMEKLDQWFSKKQSEFEKLMED